MAFNARQEGAYAANWLVLILNSQLADFLCCLCDSLIGVFKKRHKKYVKCKKIKLEFFTTTTIWKIFREFYDGLLTREKEINRDDVCSRDPNWPLPWNSITNAKWWNCEFLIATIRSSWLATRRRQIARRPVRSPPPLYDAIFSFCKHTYIDIMEPSSFEIVDLYGGQRSAGRRIATSELSLLLITRFISAGYRYAAICSRVATMTNRNHYRGGLWPTWRAGAYGPGARVSRRKTKRAGQNQNQNCGTARRRVPCPVFAATLLYARHVASRERVLVYLNLRL